VEGRGVWALGGLPILLARLPILSILLADLLFVLKSLSTMQAHQHLLTESPSPAPPSSNPPRCHDGCSAVDASSSIGGARTRGGPWGHWDGEEGSAPRKRKGAAIAKERKHQKVYAQG